MLAFIVRGVFLVGVISWYSTSVWKMIDVYFKNRFQSYLRAEYDKNPHMLADLEAYRAAAGKESSTIPTTAANEDLNGIVQTCEADVCPVSNGADLEAETQLPVEDATSNDPGDGIRTKIVEATEPLPITSENESSIAIEAPDLPAELLKNDSKKKEILRTKKIERRTVASKVEQKKATKNKLKTITLTDKDFASTRIKMTPQDFAEFDADEDSGEDGDKSVGVLVSELPYKPKADIGDLRKVSAEEYCPLTLDEEMSCDETRTWP